METIVEIFILEEHPGISLIFLNHLYLMNNFRLYFLLFVLLVYAPFIQKYLGKYITKKCVCVHVIVSLPAAYSRSLKCE